MANRFNRSIMWMTIIVNMIMVKITNSHSHTAYSHDSSIGTGNEQWMSNLADGALINSISIPGTHDTMTYSGAGGDISQTQSVSIMDQLKAGIRAFDIRCVINGNKFQIYHGIQNLGFSFDDVLNNIVSFLNSYPKEFVVMRVKKENNDDNLYTFKSIFDTYYKSYLSYMYQPSSLTPIPYVYQVRKKIVILDDFGGAVYGLNYGDSSLFDTQDSFYVASNWDLYGKWLAVKNKIIANRYPTIGKFSVNYLSGSYGSFPYFVASGHSSSGTGASRLSTGLTTPGFASSYPDFPRVNCFIGICTIAFEGVNVLFYDYLGSNPQRFVGIVYSDFPGRGLVDRIISTNFGSYSFPGLEWSFAGIIKNKYCVKWEELADPYTWSDNYLCSYFDLGLKWNSASTISGYRCTQIVEASDPHTWHDNYLCVDSAAKIVFEWSSAGPISNSQCVQTLEPSDPHTWTDNYLCYKLT